MSSVLSHRYSKLLLLLIFGILCAAAGAAGYRFMSKRAERKSILPDAQPMAASIDFARKHSCTGVSPPISIRQVPATAARISVQITDLNYMFDHGGGTVAIPSTGVIPEGALSNYMGPCPGARDHTYRFRVNALDERGLIVGIAEQSLPCCSAY
jgi:phosphatidylethanolamine-binding protein (PEBP) family uncharacterized protein